MNLFFDDYKITKPLRLIELFAGYGSQAMAFDRIGAKYEHWYVCEFDKYAIKSYNAVHGTDFEAKDIREVHASDLNIVDTEHYCYFMTYSFPCTDISVAGKMAAVKEGLKKGGTTRSGLLWEVERLLEECDELPQILFIENVPGTIQLDGFGDWCDYLRGKGYSNYVQILNAKDYGVPQNRERAFMFSFLGDWDYEFPEPVKLDKRLKDVLEDKVDEKYYINSEKAKKLIEDLIERNVIPGNEVKTICAMRGRNPEHPTSRIAGLPTKQRLEMNEQNLSNTLTTVEKDNIVVEKREREREYSIPTELEED